MSAKGEDRLEGFAAESLKGSGLKPSQSGGLHAEIGDGVLSNRSLTGHSPIEAEELEMVKNQPGSQKNQEHISQEGHGVSKNRGTQRRQGKS